MITPAVIAMIWFWTLNTFMLSVVFLQEPTNIKSAIPVCVIHVAVLIAKHAELSDNIFSVHFPPEIIVCLLAEKYN